MTRIFLLVAAVLLISLADQPVVAQVDAFQFETDEQQQRFRRLSNELRCPMCQNTNLTGSTGGVAEDLRREIHRMIMDGWTDAQIEQFMFERYGDFIFYRPRVRMDTVLLWIAPLLFLAIGAFVIVRIVKRARPVTVTSLSDEESRRLDELLDHE